MHNYPPGVTAADFDYDCHVLLQCPKCDSQWWGELGDWCTDCLLDGIEAHQDCSRAPVSALARRGENKGDNEMNMHWWEFLGRVRGLVELMETAYKYQNWPEIGQLIARLKQVEEELTATQHREVYEHEEVSERCQRTMERPVSLQEM